jgi:CheY-like chemotaxis protein
MLLESINEKNFIGKLGVLFVEDNQHDLEDLAYILNKKVDILFTASNGKEGLVTYTKNEKDIDIIITDIRMPYMSGIEMVNHIKKTNPNIKVIYLSAHNETDILLEALHMDKEFLDNANKIRKKLINDYDDIELIKANKSSKYNKNLIITKCAICQKPVDDVHHIKEKQSANKDGFIDHFHQNHKYNLIPLCKQHHKDVHDGKIIISGFFMTDKGLQLAYREC